MRYIFSLLICATPAFAQWVVNDPINTAVNTAVQAGQAANHVEVMRQWAQQLENLNHQLRQMEEELSVQRTIRDVMGDPKLAGAGVVLHGLEATELLREYGETMEAARRLANAIDSLRRTSEGIYHSLDNRTALGREFARNADLYRRFAAIETQADSMERVQRETRSRADEIQAEISATLEQLRGAATQAEADKLGAKLQALQAQLAHTDQVRQAEAEKLRAQQILNENQAAKERQDLLEKQVAEQRQTLEVVGAWQESIRITPTDYRK